jgi:hypothetical protein
MNLCTMRELESSCLLWTGVHYREYKCSPKEVCHIMLSPWNPHNQFRKVRVAKQPIFRSNQGRKLLFPERSCPTSPPMKMCSLSKCYLEVSCDPVVNTGQNKEKLWTQS